MDEAKQTPIEVNLKLPAETQDELSLGDIIRFLWNGKKMLIICTLIGLLVGAAGAGYYYISNRPKATGGKAAATIKYLYPEAASGLTPIGTPLDNALIFSPKVVDRAVAALASPDIDASVIRSNTTFENIGDTTQVKFTFSADADMVNKNIDGGAVLTALIDAYTNWFNEYDALLMEDIEDAIEFEIITAVAAWSNNFEPSVNWEELEYADSFQIISSRVNNILAYLMELYNADPAFSHEGVRYIDLYNDFYAFLTEDVEKWVEITLNEPHIKDVPLFRTDAEERIAELEREIIRQNDLLNRYMDILNELSSANANGQSVSGVDFIINIINTVARYENEINEINLSLERINDGTNAMNIAAAKRALNEALQKMNGLKETGQVLRAEQQLIYSNDFYGVGLNDDLNDELIVIMSSPAYTAEYSAAASKTRMLLLLVGLAAVGFFAGLVIILGKKYLQKEIPAASGEF